MPALSLEELKEKTDNFGSKALIGEGSYGRVYYASLNDGKAVAVKKLDVSSEPDSSVDFLTQVCLQYRYNRFTTLKLHFFLYSLYIIFFHPYCLWHCFRFLLSQG